jgi:GNAT superfamily N-acetyltransferase
MIQICEEPIDRLAEHARIPIAFTVDRVLDVALVDDGLGGIALVERRLDAPYVKDYDAIPGEGAASWNARFDVSRWGLLAAYDDDARIGGAVIAFDTPGVQMLDERRDLAVLWDLRVDPAWRGRGVGHRLFEAAERWSAARGCTALEIETQNVNVAACRFYRAMGCTLAAIDRLAYPALPDEVQLIWRRGLVARRESSADSRRSHRGSPE